MKKDSCANEAHTRPARPSLSAGLVLALLFALSGTIRFTGGTAQAIAQEFVDLAEQGPIGQQQPAAEQSIDMVALMLQELRKRESTVKEQESALSARREQLESMENQLREKITELKAAEESFEKILSVAKSAAEEDVNQVTQVYENMKPKQAAQIFEEMAPEFAAGFLGRMRPDQAAQIIGALTPEQAHAITVIIAGRNVDIPID